MTMGIVDPMTALAASFGLLGLMLFRRVRLGISLNAAAIVLALLAVDWPEIPGLIYASVDPLTVGGQLTLSIVSATFGVMVLSQLYRETGAMDELNSSLGRIIRSPRALLSVLPAVVGLLPVAGGAVMSAPMVESEGNKVGLSRAKKTYVNIWFRHLILPVYPLAPMLIITTALTGLTSSSLILMVLPIITVMAFVGYVSSLRGAEAQALSRAPEATGVGAAGSSLKAFSRSFTPIMVTIVGAVGISLLDYELTRRGIDVLVATVMGLAALAAIFKVSPRMLAASLRSASIYDITLATYGALLLRGAVNASGLPEVLGGLISGGGVNFLLTAAVSALCGFFSGSPGGGVAIGVSILGGIVNFTPREAVLTYVAAYLGYLVSPIHLCLVFTAEYFKAPLADVYKQLMPSFAVSFTAALLLYALLP
ncbi:MAG: DUF401 family protein [Candidatus Nezhaarchaeota archaeon]|nr:DUF401 family protein [Candidatus Nezhaarchaeota archaeon]